MKKILAITTAMLMVVVSVNLTPVSVKAFTIAGAAGENTKFTFDTSTGVMEFTGEGTVETEKFDDNIFGMARQYGIRKVIFHEGVTILKTDCFWNLTSLESVEMKTVSIISIDTFRGCSSLESVDLGAVEEIGEDAFLNCKKLCNIDIPDTVTSIGDKAFGFYYKEETNNETGGYFPYDNDMNLTAKCNQKAVEKYLETNKGPNWNQIHDFDNEGTVHEKAGFDYQFGYVEHNCNYGCDTVMPENVDPISSVSIPLTRRVYTGKEIKPKVTVLNRVDEELKSGTYYTVKYTNNINVGKATIKVKFKGKYEGSKKLTFTIYPARTQLKKVSGLKNGLIGVIWKKQAVQTTGYKIEVSSKKTFTKKTTKHYTIKDNTVTKTVLAGLAKNKKYYVRIRTYKTVGKKTYYSIWSSVKSTVTRK